MNNYTGEAHRKITTFDKSRETNDEKLVNIIIFTYYSRFRNNIASCHVERHIIAASRDRDFLNTFSRHAYNNNLSI